MPGPGRRSPGATCTSQWACTQMARRGRALSPRRAGLPPLSKPGPLPSHRDHCGFTLRIHLRSGRALPAPAGREDLWLCPVPGSRAPECPLRRVRSPTCVCGAARFGPGPAANDRPAPPARALRPLRGSCRSPRSRAQTRVPSPPGRAGELCRAAAVAAAAHYHRPARAAAVLKRRRPTR